MNQLDAEGELLSPPAINAWKNLENSPTTPTLPHWGELPRGYGEDYIVLMAKDPAWLFAYWEITAAGWASCTVDLQDTDCQLMLRILHMSDDSEIPLGHFDISIPPFSEDWHVNTGKIGGRFRADIGVRTPTEDFRRIASSNIVQTPRGRAAAPDIGGRTVFPGLDLPHPLDDPGTSPTNW